MEKTAVQIIAGILIGAIAGNLAVGKTTKVKVLIILIALILSSLSGSAIGFIYS